MGLVMESERRKKKKEDVLLECSLLFLIWYLLMLWYLLLFLYGEVDVLEICKVNLKVCNVIFIKCGFSSGIEMLEWCGCGVVLE